MALLHLDDGTPIPLRARHLVGRGRGCDLRLRDRAVSGEHAVFRWVDGAWSVRDLGSSNGTQVRGAEAGPGQDIALQVGDRIVFGEVRHAVVMSLEPPDAHALRLDDGVVVSAIEGLLALPDVDDPQAVVVPSTEGAWLAEQDEDSRVVRDRDVLDVGGVLWRLHLPLAVESTLKRAAAPLLLSQATLHLAVTPDEEEVRVLVRDAHRRIELAPKAHWYAIVTLARLRERDPDDGWVEREALCRMLRLARNALNVQLYRARRQLLEEGVEEVGGLIQRRGGRLRLGLTRVVLARVEE